MQSPEENKKRHTGVCEWLGDIEKEELERQNREIECDHQFTFYFFAKLFKVTRIAVARCLWLCGTSCKTLRWL